MAQPSHPPDRQFIRRTFLVGLVALAMLAALWVLAAIRNVIFMVFVSVFVAVAFEPPVHYMEKRGMRRGLATGLVFLAALLLALGFLASLAPLFITQAGELIDSIPGQVESLSVFLTEDLGLELPQFDPETVGEDLVKAIQSLGGSLVGGLLGLTSSVFGFIFFTTTVALFSFYMIAELPKLQRTVLSSLPEARQHDALRAWDVAVEKMGGYVYSRLILAVIAAAVTTGFLAWLGVPFALSLGIWVGVLSQFVPVVGTYVAAVLPALVALTFEDFLTAVWVVLFLVLYQQIENYLISPRITRRTMEIHPAVSVAAIIIGGSLMGGIGVILALPMAGIVQALISEYRTPYRVVTAASQRDVDT